MSSGREPATDRRILQEQAYPDSTNLRSRAGVYAWQQPAHDLHGIVVQELAVEPGMRVLDVGCGPGAYLARLRAHEPRLRLTGLDLSPGMAAEARSHAPVTVGDVGRLPFPDATFDRVLAPHMLYHAPDLDAAVGELRRVLRPGGAAAVVTNGVDHLLGFARLVSEATGVAEWMRTFQRFSLDEAETLLPRHFAAVRRLDLRGELVVPEVEPVVRYVASARSSLEPQLAPLLPWDEAMHRVERAVQATIAQHGMWRSATHSGVLVCR